jgi:type II secretory pathway pseudopilin PulG
VRAFTFVELMISAGLTAFILAGVLSTFLMIGRTGMNTSNYSELEAQARRALEMFAEEVRMAGSIGTTLSSTSVTLGIPDSSSSRIAVAYAVTYAYDATANTFTRTGPPLDDPAGTVATTVLISGVHEISSGAGIFNYYRYVNNTNYQNQYTYNTTTNPVEVKQIEISFIAQRTNVTVGTVTNKVLSARFILRNK